MIPLDIVAPLGGEDKGRVGEHRVTPQMKCNHTRGEGEGEPESGVGCNIIGRGEGVRGRPAVEENQEVAVNRKQAYYSIIADSVVWNLHRETWRTKCTGARKYTEKHAERKRGRSTITKPAQEDKIIVAEAAINKPAERKKGRMDGAGIRPRAKERKAAQQTAVGRNK